MAKVVAGKFEKTTQYRACVCAHCLPSDSSAAQFLCHNNGVFLRTARLAIDRESQDGDSDQISSEVPPGVETVPMQPSATPARKASLPASPTPSSRRKFEVPPASYESHYESYVVQEKKTCVSTSSPEHDGTHKNNQQKPGELQGPRVSSTVTRHLVSSPNMAPLRQVVARPAREVQVSARAPEPKGTCPQCSKTVRGSPSVCEPLFAGSGAVLTCCKVAGFQYRRALKNSGRPLHAHRLHEQCVCACLGARCHTRVASVPGTHARPAPKATKAAPSFRGPGNDKGERLLAADDSRRDDSQGDAAPSDPHGQ